MKRLCKWLGLIGLMALLSSLSACNPWRLPLLSKEAKNQEERITRETEEAIKKSSALQELDRICTQEIPRPDQSEPLRKYKSLRDEKFLGYGYRSTLSYDQLRDFYLQRLPNMGWQLSGQKEGWGPSETAFRRNGFELKISEAPPGGPITYYLHCERISP